MEDVRIPRARDVLSDLPRLTPQRVLPPYRPVLEPDPKGISRHRQEDAPEEVRAAGAVSPTTQDGSVLDGDRPRAGGSGRNHGRPSRRDPCRLRLPPGSPEILSGGPPSPWAPSPREDGLRPPIGWFAHRASPEGEVEVDRERRNGNVLDDPPDSTAIVPPVRLARAGIGADRDTLPGIPARPMPISIPATANRNKIQKAAGCYAREPTRRDPCAWVGGGFRGRPSLPEAASGIRLPGPALPPGATLGASGRRRRRSGGCGDAERPSGRFEGSGSWNRNAGRCSRRFRRSSTRGSWRDSAFRTCRTAGLFPVPAGAGRFRAW